MSVVANKKIFLSPPHMGGEELELVREAFTSNYIAPVGPMVDAFEQEFAAYTGIPHCLALASGTAAMHLALRELGVGSGDEVLASTLTFIGGVSPATFLGASLVFIDADERNWNMDPDCLAEELKECASRGKLPKAVIPTDLYGQCADLERIKQICEPYGIPVIVDAAEAMGATYKGRHAGCGAKAAVFSFNGNKIITTSGGGMLASEDAKLVEHARKPPAACLRCRKHQLPADQRFAPHPLCGDLESCDHSRAHKCAADYPTSNASRSLCPHTR